MRSRESIGKYLEVEQHDTFPGQSTSRWGIYSKSGSLLGIVKWYPRWRTYCFEPFNGTIFNDSCLRDIATFCGDGCAMRRKPASIEVRCAICKTRLGFVEYRAHGLVTLGWRPKLKRCKCQTFELEIEVELPQSLPQGRYGCLSCEGVWSTPEERDAHECKPEASP